MPAWKVLLQTLDFTNKDLIVMRPAPPSLVRVAAIAAATPATVAAVASAAAVAVAASAAAAVAASAASAAVAAVAAAAVAAVASVDVNRYNSAEDLQSAGMDILKAELQRLGLKCSGTVEMRAERLFLTKGHSDASLRNVLDAKHFAKAAAVARQHQRWGNKHGGGFMLHGSWESTGTFWKSCEFHEILGIDQARNGKNLFLFEGVLIFLLPA
jgi:hypothetical protein